MVSKLINSGYLSLLNVDKHYTFSNIESDVLIAMFGTGFKRLLIMRLVLYFRQALCILLAIELIKSKLSGFKGKFFLSFLRC